MNYVAKLEELIGAHQQALNEVKFTLRPFTDAEADYAEAEARAYLKYAEDKEEKRTVKHIEMLVARDCMKEFKAKLTAAANYKTAMKYAEGLETTISAVQSLLNREKTELTMSDLPQPQWSRSNANRR